jgi:hypothetical protein
VVGARARRGAAAVALLGAALVAVGCSTVVPGTPSAQGSGAAAAPGDRAAAAADPVAWAGALCSASLPYTVDAVSPLPPFDPDAEPADLARSFADDARDGSAATAETLAALRALGPSPLPGGDRIVADLTTGLAEYRAGAEEFAAGVDALDPDDPALLDEVTELLDRFSARSGVRDPIAHIQGAPEVRAAAEQAPSCRELERISNP